MTWRDILAAAGPAGAAGLLCYAALQQAAHPGVQTLLFILCGVFAGAFIVQTTLLITASRQFPQPHDQEDSDAVDRVSADE